MLTEHETINKLHEAAGLFESYVKNKEWGKAHAIYLKVLFVATFMELQPKTMKELFGDSEKEDEYTGEAPDDGLFRRADISIVDRESCVKRNQSYQDMAMVRAGRQLRYYSDEDYCAGCNKCKKSG